MPCARKGSGGKATQKDSEGPFKFCDGGRLTIAWREEGSTRFVVDAQFGVSGCGVEFARKAMIGQQRQQ
jgi:hypothetical protein